ncbi:MAG TPA: hypothetical protein VGB77_01405 [Abditibacteriaceae bacterium]|jgi:hypothetical protein
MKIWNLCGLAALGATVVSGMALTQLPGNSQNAPAFVPAAGAALPVEFKDYQSGLAEARLKDKPLFVVFRCER